MPRPMPFGASLQHIRAAVRRLAGPTARGGLVGGTFPDRPGTDIPVGLYGPLAEALRWGSSRHLLSAALPAAPAGLPRRIRTALGGAEAAPRGGSSWPFTVLLGSALARWEGGARRAIGGNVAWLRRGAGSGRPLLRAKGGPGAGGSEGPGGEETTKKEGDPSPDDDGIMDALVPRTCLFVLLMFALTAALWSLAQPSGRHVGWATLTAKAGEIRSVHLYEHYLQVYLDHAKVYLGLVHDADTERKVSALARSYEQAVQTAASSALARGASNPKGSEATNTATADDDNEKDDEEEGDLAVRSPTLPVHLHGRPVAENVLHAVGAFAAVVPFVFFPVFVMILTHYIGKTASYAVRAGEGRAQMKEMAFRVESAASTRFRDIAGMKEAKAEITEVVDFLRHPERYTRLGAAIPTGALLLGPPGTGKTLLAKAVAGEGGVGFIPVCGSDFVELYVGMGALRVRQLFAEARKQRCVVYIDEMDAIGLKRQGTGHGEKQEQEQTLNELLTQLDGFATGRRGDVMVIASSNVSQSALDPALIRPGRFDRIIHVDPPVMAERVDIFKVHLSRLRLMAPGETSPAVEPPAPAAAPARAPEKTAIDTETRALVPYVAASTPPRAGPREGETVAPTNDEGAAAEAAPASAPHAFDFHALLEGKTEAERGLLEAYARRMSDLCPGFVGADVANVCNEAAILAAREDAACVDGGHLERSIDRVLAGIEHRSRVLSAFEKNVVAHHEAGHAVAGWFLHRADPLMKVSIVPRGGSALGYAQYLPKEHPTRTAREIRDAMSVALGGRVAEWIFFGHLSTGASDDLRKVGQMAYEYVSSFAPGAVYPAPGSRGTRLVKPYGASKADEYDLQAKALVDEVYALTYDLLLRHKRDMEVLARHLLEHEVLTHQDVLRYLGHRETPVSERRREGIRA